MCEAFRAKVGYQYKIVGCLRSGTYHRYIRTYRCYNHMLQRRLEIAGSTMIPSDDDDNPRLDTCVLLPLYVVIFSSSRRKLNNDAMRNSPKEIRNLNI